ncbi:MAG: hypothetical protein VB860_00300 [Dehalococcoidia bacterium]
MTDAVSPTVSSAVVVYDVGTVHLAAGLAIAQELGLKVTDGGGGELDWGTKDPWPVMIAAWADAHDGLLELMR